VDELTEKADVDAVSVVRQTDAALTQLDVQRVEDVRGRRAL